MKNRQLYIAAYDISCAKRLRKALYTVRGYASGGQKSVFECFLTPAEKAQLLDDVNSIIDPEEDRFILLRFLNDALASRADIRYPLIKATKILTGIIGQLREDTQDITLASLRGYEGAAAAAYFGGYVHLFADALNFTGRKKRPPPDPVNVCLSLGYTLLHYDAVRACHIVGLDPMLGFFHDVCFGRESLACDLMEPLRPLMDRWIWQLFKNKQLRPEHFSDDVGGRCQMNKVGRQVFYAYYESQAGPARRLLRSYAYALRLSNAPTLY